MRKRIAAVCENSQQQIRKRKRVFNHEKKPQQKSSTTTSDSSATNSSSEELSDSNNECSSPERKQQLFEDGSPKPEFLLSRDLVNGTILTDIAQKRWRIGKPIGKGSFGEIFLASDEVNVPVTSSNAKYVVKIEPHSNGPLFVEIHCLLNTTTKQSEESPLPGLPKYIASGSHYFRETRYRFLVIPRFDRDLRSLIKHRRVDQKSLITLAIQILDVLQMLHDKGYCHSDIKAENLMISKCTYKKQKSSTLENKTSATTATDEKQYENSKRFRSRRQKTSSSESEDENCSEDEGNCSQSESLSDEDNESGSSSDIYKTPIGKRSRPKVLVEYGGSNPVRSCRVNNGRSREQKTATPSSIYQEMVSSHYLRPSKRINYAEFFADEPIRSQAYHANLTAQAQAQAAANSQYETVTEERIFLIDFGLASKFVDSNGVHRPFFTDQRRAHDGTLEFTSRDAHLGAHSRRSDLECFGYNLIFWSEGYLPWKEYANQQQLEKVHWMKEYLMKDVREMLNHIYGKSVPKYLGEYMHYVGKLGYQERPDYEKCKQMFLREYKSLGYDCSQMSLKSDEIAKNTLTVLENNNFCELKHIKSIMKNLGVIMPLTLEPSSASRISPKSLRSKSDKKEHNGEKKNGDKKKKFSWTEILSQDPDQIARERAEKEFERDANETPLIKYTGKPTYAILDIERRLKLKSEQSQCENITDTEALLEGYNRPMMDVLRKIQQQCEQEQKPEEVAATESVDSSSSSKKSKTEQIVRRARGRPRKLQKTKQNQSTNASSTFTTTDESSSSSDCSTNHSPYKVDNFGSSIEGLDSLDDLRGQVIGQNGNIKTRHTSSKVNVKSSSQNCLYSGLNGLKGVQNILEFEEKCDQKLIGARRRKRNVPKKSNGGVTKVIRKIKNQSPRSRIKRERFNSDYFYDYEVANYTSDENVDDDDDEEFIPHNIKASHFEIAVGLASGRHYKKGVRRGL